MMIRTSQSFLNTIFQKKIWYQFAMAFGRNNSKRCICLVYLSTVEVYPAKSCNTFCAMRVCGICHFGSHMATEPLLLPAPAAALVLAFSSTQLHGSHGIVRKIENLSEEKPLSMAAAYCCVCRRCTWLCRTDADINEACLEFLHMWRTGEQINASLALMHR
jgi:hypothetical protein